MDQFEAYFRRADLDQDGRISGAEAVSFLQGSNLPKQVLAQIWMYADQSQTGFLSRQDFYNALKLVTVAQSKRELTPDIVKAALFGPASAKIPAPQINLAAIPGPQPNNMSNSPVPSVGAGVPSAGPSSGTRGHQVFQPQQSQLARPPRPPAPSTTFQSHPAVSGPGVPVGSTMTSSNSPISPDMNGGRTSGSQPGVTPQLSYRGISPKSHDGFGLVASGSTPPQSKPQDAALPGHHPPAKDSKTHQATGNGFSSNSLFGDVFSATSIQPNQASKPPKSSASSVSISSSPNPVSSGSQQKVKSNSIDSLQNMHSKQPAGYQYQQTPSSVKQYQHVPLQTSNAIPGGAGNTASSQSQLPWPRMTQADVQKYSKVFVAVDTDRDGKITGDVLPKQSLFFDSVPSTPSYNAPTQAGDKFSKQMPFFDSVPSTPSYNAGFTQAGDTFSKQSSFFDSVPSTPNYNAGFTQAGDTFSKQGSFFDSVPSTPSYNTGFSYTENAFSKQSPFFDSVPSTPAYSSNLHADDMFQRKSSFADSVPSTPMYGSTNSPRRFSEGPEEFSRDFSRFDSFSSHDGSNLFAPDASFSRFDSMRSTKDSEFDHGLFPPHDSLARFDSFRSTADSEYTFGNPPPRDSFARFDSFRSTKDSEYGHGFASFDDADPFGSSGPFKTSFESETPRRDSSGPFKTSFESETPRRDSDSWKAF
nr:epidermal growth factor receptor substrate 15-like 1 [Ipomoea batatas]